MTWPETRIGFLSYTLAPEMCVLLWKGVAEFPVNRHLSPLNRSFRLDDWILVFRNIISWI